MISENFSRIARYTACLIFNYWHQLMQGESWPTLPEIVNVTGDQQSRRIEAAFDFQSGNWAKVSVFVVSRYSEEAALYAYESEIETWDRKLFFEEKFDGESQHNFDLDQRLRLEVARPYPSRVRFNSLELLWQLVHAQIEFFRPDGKWIATQDYPVGELRAAFWREKIHGIIPISGDDYPDALKLIEGIRSQQGDYDE